MSPLSFSSPLLESLSSYEDWLFALLFVGSSCSASDVVSPSVSVSPSVDGGLASDLGGQGSPISSLDLISEIVALASSPREKRSSPF
jgi:hypothetical protein